MSGVKVRTIGGSDGGGGVHGRKVTRASEGGGKVKKKSKLKQRSFCQRLIDSLDSPAGESKSVHLSSALLRLPTEIRQQMFYCTIDDDEMLNADLDRHAADLGSVCHTFRDDSLWVFKRWTIRRTEQRGLQKGAFDNYINDLMSASHLDTGRTTKSLRPRKRPFFEWKDYARLDRPLPNLQRSLPLIQPGCGTRKPYSVEQFKELKTWREARLKAIEEENKVWQSGDVGQQIVLRKKRKIEGWRRRRANSMSSLHEQIHGASIEELRETTDNAEEEARALRRRKKRERREENRAKFALKVEWDKLCAEASFSDWAANNPEEAAKREAVLQMREAYGGFKASETPARRVLKGTKR